MVQIAAYEDIKHGRKERVTSRGYTWHTDFFEPPEGETKGAHAYLAEGTGGRIIRPHFHNIDEFQVVVSGGGVLGKHPLEINTVHFVRAYTPYAITGGDQGLGFLTLRTARHSGARHLPECREELNAIPNRQPWQRSEVARFDRSPAGSLQALSRLNDDRGLAAFSLTLNAGSRATAPAPSTSAGQFLAVTNGSLLHAGKEYKSITLVYLEPDEKAFSLVAGTQGLEVLVLNFPRNLEQSSLRNERASGERVFQCELCGFSYSEARGLPAEGIAPNTAWEKIPVDWKCPDCSADKSDFKIR